jgi:hypothetical protein
MNLRYPLISEEQQMTAASRIFRGAAIYGVIVLLPMFVTEAKFGQDYPPPVTHAEFYYGFAGITLLWQLAFWIIGSDPVRLFILAWRSTAARSPAVR